MTTENIKYRFELDPDDIRLLGLSGGVFASSRGGFTSVVWEVESGPDDSLEVDLSSYDEESATIRVKAPASILGSRYILTAHSQFANGERIDLSCYIDVVRH